MKNKSSRNPNKRQSKDNHFQAQLVIFYHYLLEHIATASMVREATGIPQKNICRYKRKLEKAGRLWQVVKKECKKTRKKAWYLTTNPNNVPIDNQLKLF